MTTKFTHTKLCCPFCPWDNRSFMLPYHIITHHPTEVVLRHNLHDHCMSAYIKRKEERIHFSVCLTCNKGIVESTCGKNESRWFTMHSKNEVCKQNHKSAINKFKQTYKELSTDKDIYIQPPISQPIDTLWSVLKQKPALKSYITEIEQTCIQYHEDDDEPYTFKPEDGIEQLVISAIGYKKHITQLENKIKTMESEHERQMMDMRDRILELERNVRDLQVALRQESYKAQNAQARCDFMERELNRYKERYPALPDEDPV